jgi:hypothetical protein
MRTSAGRKVPTSEPAVDSAYSRPATAPAVAIAETASLIANGETIPRRTTGGAQSSNTATKLPITAPADAVSRPSTVKSRNGFAANGINAMNAAAASTIAPSSLGSGRRSARRPPSQ